MNVTDAVPIFIDRMDGIPTKMVSMRDLFNWLNLGSKYGDWVKRRFERYEFLQDLDYVTVEIPIRYGKKLRNVRLTRNHHITIDTAEKLCMVELSEKARIARAYFRRKRVELQHVNEYI